jgi:glycosyltransferase involved in cell wall biosynthesis
VTELRRVVLVVPLAPAPGGNGLAMRAGMLLETLAEGAAVDVVVVPVSGPAADLEWARNFARSVHVMPPVPVESAREHVTAQLADARLRDRLERTVPVPARTAAAPPTLAADIVAALAPGPIAVLGMRSYLAPLASEVAQRLGAARLVIDLDDDDASLLRALGEGTEADKYDRLARVWLPEADALLTASPVDADAVVERHGLGRVHAVPNAVRPPPEPAAPSAGARLLFVGNLTYTPNIDAAAVLIDEVLPSVQQHRPEATLELVGPSVPGELDRLAAGPGVHVAGFVDDLSSSYARATLVVIPLRHGGGTRIKVLEAFAHRRPVVATPAAVAGLAVRDGEDVVVADTPAELADAVVALLDDPHRAAAIVEHARRTLEEHYVPAVVGPTLRQVVLGSPPL